MVFLRTKYILIFCGLQVNQFLFGGSAVLNTSKGLTPTDYTIAGGYRSGDIIATSTIKNGSDVEGSIYHAPRAGVKAGVIFNFARETAETNVISLSSVSIVTSLTS